MIFLAAINGANFNAEGLVHPKMKISLPSGYLIYRNRFGEIEHYITCSPMDPLK